MIELTPEATLDRDQGETKNNQSPPPGGDSGETTRVAYVQGPCHDLRDIGWAIRQLKAGKRVCRRGWNGRNMYLWLLPEAMVKAEWCREPHLKEVAEANGGEIKCLGSIRLMTVQHEVLTGWLASQTDLLSQDYEEVP